MTDPLITIQAAAAAIGISAVVEVGDEQELNMLLDSAVEYPLVAVVSVGPDCEQRYLRPDASYGYYLKWGCIAYILDKVPLDDTGAARHTTNMELIAYAMDLHAQININTSPALAHLLPKNASFSVLPYNKYDANLAGVMMALTIPDTYEYCP